jgi:hypothetical protein
MTWKDIKLATLQKMFAAEGNTIPNDESTTDYLAGMPQVCNEALTILSRVGKFIIKHVDIAHNPIPSMFKVKDSKLLLTEPYEVSATDAKAYYFEYSGTGTFDMYVDGELVVTEQLNSEGSYAIRKGLLNGKEIRFVFTPLYPLQIRNISFYACAFANDESVPEYKSKVRYELPVLAEDFYRIDSIYYEGENPRYIQSNEYFFEGNRHLVLDRDMPGNYTVYYKAYPPEITIDTLDDYVFPVDKEVAVLIPIYMASELYKDDDAGIATGYRNEFEIELERLSDTSQQAPTAEEFESESGWC